MRTTRRSTRLLRGLLGVALAVGLMPFARPSERAAEVDEARLRAVMAAYLVNFAVHVRWPEEAEDDRPPLTIAILGQDRLGEALDRTAAGRTAHGRPLRIVRLERIEDFAEGDIVFMDNPAQDEAGKVVRALAGRPVLFVAFSGTPEGTSAAVDLVLMRDGTLRYKLAVTRLREAGLTPSAGLLQNALRGDDRRRLPATGGTVP